MSEKGKKFDGDFIQKPPMDLIPYEAKVAMAQVLGFGRSKYGRAQWTNGIEYSRLLSAAERHMGQFNTGQDVDSESNLNHIAHAAVNLCMLLWMVQNKPDMDDRWAKK
jgi:hypothetical protein